MTSLVLTNRDMEVLAMLEEHCAVPVRTIAERLFRTNPFTGAPNKSPLQACERRLSSLRAHGYLELERVRDRGRVDLVARPARSADAALGTRASRKRIAVIERVHHVRTLDAVDAVDREMKKRGGRIVRFTLEAGLRAAEQRGRRTRRGDTFEAFPDAVCTIALPTKDGERV